MCDEVFSPLRAGKAEVSILSEIFGLRVCGGLMKEKTEYGLFFSQNHTPFSLVFTTGCPAIDFA
ncbi:MAG TPA: hypothetical protein DCP71_13400 [Verrucomicrobiales bacterium]|nr:hypothetical protein [Verrucomicrobiales bacterium]